jgi:hypothetical protein
MEDALFKSSGCFPNQVKVDHSKSKLYSERDAPRATGTTRVLSKSIALGRKTAQVMNARLPATA